MGGNGGGGGEKIHIVMKQQKDHTTHFFRSASSANNRLHLLTPLVELEGRHRRDAAGGRRLLVLINIHLRKTKGQHSFSAPRSRWQRGEWANVSQHLITDIVHGVRHDCMSTHLDKCHIGELVCPLDKNGRDPMAGATPSRREINDDQPAES